jgi:signal transduction histidine kinase
LIAANTAKDQFLALLSHELRNPLSPVIAMVAELEARSSNKTDLRQPLAVIRRNVELEARLIDDLLDVTRIAKGKLQLSFEVTSAHETLERAYEFVTQTS